MRAGDLVWGGASGHGYLPDVAGPELSGQEDIAPASRHGLPKYMLAMAAAVPRRCVEGLNPRIQREVNGVD